MEINPKSIISSARKLFPDCVFDCQFEAMLPVYRVRLVGSIQTGATMSSVARFVLRSISSDVNTLTSISDLLGLEITDVGRGAGELRGLGLIDAFPLDNGENTRFAISSEGKRYIKDNTKLFKLRKSNLQFEYNALTGEYQTIDEDNVSLDEVRKSGDFVEPIVKRRPSPKDIRIADLRAVVMSDGQLNEDADVVGVVKMDQPYTCYRPVSVVVLKNMQDNQSRILVFRGRAYLEKESQELQRLLEKGKEVIQPGLARPQESINQLPGASPEERSNINRIYELEGEIDDIETVLEGDSVKEEDKAQLNNQISQLKKQFEQKANELESLKKRHEAETKGSAKHIAAHEHRPLLIRALHESASFVLIVVPWLVAQSFDNTLCLEISGAISRGIKIIIVYGLGTKRGSQREQAKARSKPAIDKLRDIAKKVPGAKLIIVEKETHEKLLFCDSKFAVIGSYNWLSASATPNHKESSLYTERPLDIQILKKEYSDILEEDH